MTADEIKSTNTEAPAKRIKRKKKHKGIESLKSTYGRLFVLHWEIGLIIFFIVPLFQSFYYSFCELNYSAGTFIYDYIGLDNFKYAINEHAEFTDLLTQSLISLAYSLPVIVILSLILALLLNQNFKGRLFFRALYFLPVIIASGVVIEHLFASTGSELSSSGVSSSFASNMISVEEILAWLSLPTEIGTYFNVVFNNIFNLVWNCGIQIVLFIAGMQSIPDSLYEVSKVEGATKWEEFWFITLPMLARTTILVIIFTLVELITSKTNDVMALAYTFMKATINYGKASAMLWIYFIIVGALIALIMLLYSKFCLKRWDSGR